MENKTHWRTGGKLTNAGCEMLPDGKDIDYIVIKSIEYKDEHTINGRKESGVWVATFEQNPYTTLPMILNSTNRKRLSKMFGTDYIDTLTNIAVRLTKEKTRDPQEGGETWGLRIHKDKPKAPVTPKKPVLTESHEKFNDCKAKVVSKEYTVEQLRAWFDISAEVEELLTKVEG